MAAISGAMEALTASLGQTEAAPAANVALIA
jgi:hypothetical protein